MLSDWEKQQLSDQLYEQLGSVALPGVTRSSNPLVRLVLVDTAPTTIPSSQDNSMHGSSLFRMAKHLICPQGLASCEVDLQTRLALSFLEVDPRNKLSSTRDTVRGGYRGLIGEFAEALIAELQNWPPQPVGRFRDRLILNASLAWDGMFGGTEATPVDMPNAVRAVYEALECHASEGNLVIAAAGNFSDDHESNVSDMPLYPAAWTQREASSGGPLLYAAGGVDVKRRPLGNALGQGIPEFVAFADHALAAKDEDAILTGSSVAAMGVSAAAAAVAYYAPELNREEVMEMVWSSGKALGWRASFCRYPSGSCPQVSYISVCESVLKACASQGDCVPPLQLPVCAPRPQSLLPFPGTPPTPLTAFDLALVPGAAQSTNFCIEPWVDTSSASDVPCPQRQFHGTARQPMTSPQPLAEKCFGCKLKKGDGGSRSTGGSFLELEFSGLSQGQQGPVETVRDVTLTLSHCLGRQIYTNQWPGRIFHDGDQLYVDLLPDCESAVLHYTVYSGSDRLGSMTSPLLVVRRY